MAEAGEIWIGLQVAFEIISQAFNWPVGYFGNLLTLLFNAAPGCDEICAMVDYIKQNGTVDHWLEACRVAKTVGCSCTGCPG